MKTFKPYHWNVEKRASKQGIMRFFLKHLHRISRIFAYMHIYTPPHVSYSCMAILSMNVAIDSNICVKMYGYLCMCKSGRLCVCVYIYV